MSMSNGRPSNAALVQRVVSQALPNALSQLALVLVSFITVLFVSQLHDSDTLGGVGIGSMLYNIFGLSLGFGMTSGLDTLVSQSNGAGLYERSGVYLQRAVVVCTLVCVPACCLLAVTTDALIALGQDVAIAAAAGDYVRGTIPSMWLMYISSAIGTYLRAQTLPQASVYATWSSNVFHIGSCYLFIWHWQMGAFGAGLAFSCTQALSFFILLGYVQLVRPGVTQKSWIRWDCRRATTNLRGFLDKALPCAMLMWAEWWCAEVMTLMAGWLGVAALAAHTAVLQVFVLIYMTAGGISCAGAALVGNAIGAASADLARQSALISVAVMMFASAAIDMGLLLKPDSIASLFTEDPAVHGEILALLRILLVVVPLDSLQTVIDGILRGLGKQALAFQVKIVCMWGVRFPLALYLGLHTSLGIRGIWLGSAAGLAATMVIYVALVLRIDWPAEVSSSDIAYQKFSSPAYGGRERVGSDQSQAAVPGLCRSPPPNSVFPNLFSEEDDAQTGTAATA